MGNVDACKMHDIVHDFVQFLSKKECIIIEGVEGANKIMELAEGDTVRHLTFTEVKDGPLPLSKYKNIRTLSILGSDTPTISPGSILQLKCLRTLKLRRNRLRELPEEIGELIHMRCMDLSKSRNLKKLPEAVCDLCNLQTLDLRQCWELEKLPKAMGKLINLKHLYVLSYENLKFLPKGIGNLKRLQILDWFIVCKDEDVEALKLGDLANMGQLQGRLVIDKLGWKEDDASEIEKAQLRNKEHLSDLGVFFYSEYEEQRKGDSEIVKAMQPHPNLESIRIRDCHGTTESLYWINSSHNLRRVHLYGWRFCEALPPFGKLPSLKILEISVVDKVKKVRVEFLASKNSAYCTSPFLPREVQYAATL